MKLNKVKEYNTTTYEVGNEYLAGFLVDIVEKCDKDGNEPHDNCWEAWLYHKTIGTKELMFGMLKEDALDYEFLDMVADNLKFGTYLKNYIRTYIWEETEE